MTNGKIKKLKKSPNLGAKKYKRSKPYTVGESESEGGTPRRVINHAEVKVGPKDVADNAYTAKYHAKSSRKPAKTAGERYSRRVSAKLAVTHMTAAAEGRARKKKKK